MYTPTVTSSAPGGVPDGGGGLAGGLVQVVAAAEADRLLGRRSLPELAAYSPVLRVPAREAFPGVDPPAPLAMGDEQVVEVHTYRLEAPAQVGFTHANRDPGKEIVVAGVDRPRA